MLACKHGCKHASQASLSLLTGSGPTNCIGSVTVCLSGPHSGKADFTKKQGGTHLEPGADPIRLMFYSLAITALPPTMTDHSHEFSLEEEIVPPAVQPAAAGVCVCVYCLYVCAHRAWSVRRGRGVTACLLLGGTGSCQTARVCVCKHTHQHAHSH